jgi:hypothetical protein
MKKQLLNCLITFIGCGLLSCQNSENELNIRDYWISFQKTTDKEKAQCVLEYIYTEKLDLKKYQLFDTQKDTVLLRIFGKPKGKYKKEEDRRTAEFAVVLLANDFAKLCLRGKVVKIQIGQSFAQASAYLEATSDGKVGYREYKP